MGEIIGAGIVSHVPTLMCSEEERMQMNNGKEFTIVTGLHRMRDELIQKLKPDTIVIFDTHWHTTYETVVDGRAHFKGFLTSDEMPRTIASFPYDYPGDPELAQAIEDIATANEDKLIYVSRDPNLPVHYGTVNIVHYVGRGERVLSISCAQTGEPQDFLNFGKVLRQAIEKVDRRVVLLASGGLSHKFFPLSVIRNHESADLSNVISKEARDMDLKIISLLEQGKHKEVIDLMPEFLPHGPEGSFGHYLMMVSALGGEKCIAKGRKMSDYEASVGTGQVHMWFDRPAQGWTA